MTADRPTTPEERDPLADRLRAAFPDEVAPATRHRDLAAIDEALGGSARRVRRGAAVVLAGLLVGAPAGALASESALPGEALYPVKRVTEVVRSVFDEDVVDRHRVEEAEVLAARALDGPAAVEPDDDEVADAVEAAFDAVVATDDRPDADDLRRRAVQAADRVREQADRLTVALPGPDAARLARQRAERLERLRVEMERQRARREAAALQDQRPDDDAPTTDAQGGPDTASPSPSPTRSTTGASTNPDDAPEDGASTEPAPSPSPTRSTTDSASPRPTATASPSPSPTRDSSTEPRKERHEVGRAGVVHLVVRADGVRLSEVVLADGWTARSDRSKEPAGFVVEFRRSADGRGWVFTARYRDDGTVETTTREVPPPDQTQPDDPSPSPTASPKDEPSRTEEPTSEPTRSTDADRP